MVFERAFIVSCTSRRSIRYELKQIFSKRHRFCGEERSVRGIFWVKGWRQKGGYIDTSRHVREPCWLRAPKTAAT